MVRPGRLEMIKTKIDINRVKSFLIENKKLLILETSELNILMFPPRKNYCSFL